MSNDNSFIESLFKTLKYRPGFPTGGFAELSCARLWVHLFVNWYNDEHRHSALKYVTPNQRHSGQAKGVLAARKRVYQQAKAKYPQRWSREIRNFDLPEEVHSNPGKPAKKTKEINQTTQQLC